MGTFAAWLDSELKSNRLSQRQFADLAGVSKSAVGAWVKGDRVPDPENCRKIAKTFDLGWDEVLTRAGHRVNVGDFELDDPRQRVIDLVSILDITDPAAKHWLSTAPLVLETLKQVHQEEEAK